MSQRLLTPPLELAPLSLEAAVETSASSPVGKVLSGRYRLRSKLGTGGMATVYLAHDNTLDRAVAIKLLNDETSAEPHLRERFNREARDVAKLSHPNVVSVTDAGEDGGRRYIVFEFVEGETLKQRIRRQGQLPPDEAAAYAIEIGRGLAAAHARKLIHRDVKPQNVLIDGEGRAKLTDFGIARSIGEGTTATGKVLGTTDYVSPEQAMGDAVDERSDVYSLGIVLYEMLTGDVPFHASTPVAVAMKHVNEAVPDVQRRRPETSAALAAVVEKATEKDPRRRYPGVAEMLDDLEAALEVEVSRSPGPPAEEATTVLETVPAQRRVLSSQRAPRAGIAMALAGVGILVAVVALTSGGGGSHAKAFAIRPHAAHDFDPLGDGGEHPETTGLAVDGNPSGTPWETEGYVDPALGGKAGVGLYVDAGRQIDARAVEVRTSTPGWNAEVRVAPGPTAPASLDGWTIAGHVTGAASRERISVDSHDGERYYLLWLTHLAPGGSGAGGGYRVAIDDIRLLR
jgi:hypothetical protein